MCELLHTPQNQKALPLRVTMRNPIDTSLPLEKDTANAQSHLYLRRARRRHRRWCRCPDQRPTGAAAVSSLLLPAVAAADLSPPTHAPPAYGPTVGGAQFAQTIVGGQLFVQIRDQILPGDALRAEAFRRTLPVGVPVIVLLNSPGGSAIDSWLIAAMIRRGGASTYVVNDCESACFLMFAAGRQRGYASGARIGVHRASNGGGQETLQTEHGTVTLAKAYELLGVPPAIIGRMVTTEPGAMAFLTSAELASMGAVQIPSR